MRKVFAWLKRYMPQSLFGRSLLIIVVPVAFMQAAVAAVFFDAHWRTVTETLADSTAGDVALVAEMMTPLPARDARQLLIADAASTMSLSVAWQPGRTLPTRERFAFFSVLDQVLEDALERRLQRPFWFDTTRYPGYVDIRVGLEGGVLRILAPRERVFSTTGHIFIFWLAAATLLLTAVSVIFIRNQVRAIERLARAAEAFGRGQDVARFKPTGAREVRQAAHAFLAMKARIRRHIDQRTTLLAAVSHDLRTPLTRLKLATAMMPEGEERDGLRQDIADMEYLIDEYLDFAGSATQESTETVDLAKWLRDEHAHAQATGHEVKITVPDELMVSVKPQSLKRCVRNLLSNALKYGQTTEITAQRDDNRLLIIIDDDGPGLPPEMFEEAFIPFNRLDEARDPNVQGAGLGLAIARDAARRQGGEVTLEASPLGGLRAVIRLPI